jgi:hypothetical protein
MIGVLLAMAKRKKKKLPPRKKNGRFRKKK